jgi:hypothetical protein
MKAGLNRRWMFWVVMLSIFLCRQATCPAAESHRQAVRIPWESGRQNPATMSAGPKMSCLLEYQDGTAWTYYPNYETGDKNVTYFDAQQCAAPHPFPFQLTDVEFMLFNHAGVGSVLVDFGIWAVGSGPSQGPQERLWTSPTYTVSTFYPDWASVSLPDPVCASAPFFFGIEYLSGEQGSIPSLAADDQQQVVDTYFQWLWLGDYSPPWREWNAFWNSPEPGWLMLRLTGETYSLTCETEWVWLADNSYAPSGLPDVNAGQSGWTGRCGPVALGDCMQWYGTDVNLFWSVPQMVDTLSDYLRCDSSGTEVHGMKSGVDDFLNAFALNGLYSSLWSAPDFYVMTDSLEVSQTIVLLLGFWWWDGENWRREGGHFVALSGIHPDLTKVALSDPDRDAAEHAWPGRVRPADHPSPPHADTLHNDPLYVSHDIYQCSLGSPGPMGISWQLTDYLEPEADFPRQYTGMNFPSEFDSLFQSAPPGTSFVTEVEYAVMLCTQQEHMYWEANYADYAPSGMPDFDEKQDQWVNPTTGRSSFCGPVAVANSFWWLDSKLNLPAGSMGDGMDQFPLVRDYLNDLTPYAGWDDHDLWNVDHSATPWTGTGPPPTTPQPFLPGPQGSGGMSSWGELVERLAWNMDTDGRRTAIAHTGTKVQDMDDAVQEWFSSETFSDGKDLSDSLCVKIYQKPSFFLVDTLVRQHGNVVLLLGFWYQDSNKWWRTGGHYVTVAGVNPVQAALALSDPFFDNAESGALGRVLSGWYIPHTPVPHSDSTMHNDPGNVSQDIYYPDFSFSNPGGVWQLQDYAIDSDPDSLMSVFYQQNFPQEFMAYARAYTSGRPVNTVVEYAIFIDQLQYRGDVTNDGVLDLGDALAVINYLFKHGATPQPLYWADVNCDQTVDIGDIVFILNYLFRNGPVSRCCGT